MYIYNFVSLLVKKFYKIQGKISFFDIETDIIIPSEFLVDYVRDKISNSCKWILGVSEVLILKGIYSTTFL